VSGHHEANDQLLKRVLYGLPKDERDSL
jgi:hypothetical protein